jgi:membrane protein DedA with SNARE-associated domain
MVRRSLIVWLAMLIMASVNGGVREALLVPSMGPGAARVVSTLLLCAIVFLLTYLTIRWIDPRSSRDAWIVGAIWVAFTLGFEFLAGHFLFGHPWSELLEEYDVFRGRIWILAVVTILVAPWVCVRARRRATTRV